MTEAMPFLQKTILLSYDPRSFWAVFNGVKTMIPIEQKVRPELGIFSCF